MKQNIMLGLLIIIFFFFTWGFIKDRTKVDINYNHSIDSLNNIIRSKQLTIDSINNIITNYNSNKATINNKYENTITNFLNPTIISNDSVTAYISSKIHCK